LKEKKGKGSEGRKKCDINLVKCLPYDFMVERINQEGSGVGQWNIRKGHGQRVLSTFLFFLCLYQYWKARFRLGIEGVM
jgi:hypothetical protein